VEFFVSGADELLGGGIHVAEDLAECVQKALILQVFGGLGVMILRFFYLLVLLALLRFRQIFEQLVDIVLLLFDKTTFRKLWAIMVLPLR